MTVTEILLPIIGSKLSISNMPYEGQCLCKGSKVFVDGEPRFKVHSGILLALSKPVNDDTHRAWVPATARIVGLAAAPHLLVGYLWIANMSDQRDQSRSIPL